MKTFYHKNQIAWAMYDWGNSAYATAVMAGFFPIFFKEFYSFGVEPSVSTSYLGFANAFASLVIFVLAPILGTYSDLKAAKKTLLGIFAFIGIFFTASLFFIEKADYITASFFYGISSIGFMGANLFYDSLIHSIAKEKDLDRVSTLGYSLGYLGGGILFLITVVIVQMNETLGIEISTAVKFSFVLTALWWGIFAIPLFKLVEEEKKEEKTQELFSTVFKDLSNVFIEIKSYKIVLLFLVAYWFYIDGVDTIIKMAVDFGLSIGLVSSDMITALLLIQFVGFPATLVVGKITNTFETRKVILGLIFIYLGIVVGAYFMTTKEEFFILALLIAFSQGGVQALSRSYYASIIPKEKSGEFFGFYNMMGKFASIFGPLLIALTALATGDNRVAILSISLLFIFGAGVLLYQMKIYKN